MSYIYIAHIHSGNNNGICTGHFFPVAEMYYRLLSSINPVIIAGGELYAKHFSDHKVLQLPYSISLLASPWITLLKMFRNASFLFNRAKDNIVVLQDGKPLATYLCILFFYKKCDLYLLKYSLDINSNLKHFVYSMIKNRIKGVICPNDEIGKAYGLPYCVVPDYIYTGSGNPIDWKRYSERKYDFSCLGRIEPEKGVIEVAKKFKSSKYKILIAGNPRSQQQSDELIKICKDANNIDLRLGYLNDEDYNKALHDTRYAMLNYHGVYANRSSGVVFDMVFNGVPVIGRKSLALQFVGDENVGFLYDDINLFNPEKMFDEVIHNTYLENIKKYFLKHIEFKQKLIEFFGVI